jgi:hypothetical protein
MTHNYPEYASLFQDVLDSNRAPLVRLAAAMALARALRVVDPERAADALVRVANDTGWTHVPSPWDDAIFVGEERFEMLDAALRERGIQDEWNPAEYIYDYVCAPLPRYLFVRGGGP